MRVSQSHCVPARHCTSLCNINCAPSADAAERIENFMVRMRIGFNSTGARVRILCTRKDSLRRASQSASSTQNPPRDDCLNLLSVYTMSCHVVFKPSLVMPRNFLARHCVFECRTKPCHVTSCSRLVYSSRATCHGGNVLFAQWCALRPPRLSFTRRCTCPTPQVFGAVTLPSI